jgi:hypothetical protein
MNDSQTPFDQIAPDDEAQSAAPLDSPVASPIPKLEEHREQARRLDEEFEQEDPRGGGWTIPFLSIGIALIACCMLIPATEDNRRLVFEREHLKADLEQINRQIEVNDEFLKRIASDPSLSERLAQRQMKLVREGSSVLALRGEVNGRDMSPYELTTLAPPAPMPPYQPRGGMLATLVSNPRSQLLMMGIGMLLVAAGLVLGYTPPHASRAGD